MFFFGGGWNLLPCVIASREIYLGEPQELWGTENVLWAREYNCVLARPALNSNWSVCGNRKHPY